MAPSHTEKENCRKFAKFCFKVIKNECSNIKRAAGIRKEYDATGEERWNICLNYWRMRIHTQWKI